MNSGGEAGDIDRVAPLLKTKLESSERPRLVLREDLLEAVTEGLACPPDPDLRSRGQRQDDAGGTVACEP